jgi:hypothetical protein
MSVLGIKDWFLEDTTSGPPETDLVLTRYPLAFVQKARQKVRGEFFSSADLLYEEANTTGTLLPVSDKSVGQRRIACNPSLAGSEDHPSVAGWILQPNGAVFLPEVGIVAGFPQRSTRSELARVLVPLNTPGVPICFNEEVEPNNFLASFSPEIAKYAVCLLRAGKVRMNEFIIAREKQYEDGSVDGPKIWKKVFRKIAVFF